jgi:uncharacterized 2Fe-2S/4Fe-4S cluster protein (DUF4445 family)
MICSAKETEQQIKNYTYKKQWGLTETEPLFETADVGRFGKDLFVQRSVTTNDFPEINLTPDRKIRLTQADIRELQKAKGGD